MNNFQVNGIDLDDILEHRENWYMPTNMGYALVCGDNTYGGLGDNTTIDRYNLEQIGTANEWKSISTGQNFTGIKTDGTLWACGWNGGGAIGDGTLINKSSPVQIGSLTNWKRVYPSRASSIAERTDGTLWIWGYNLSGELGQNDRTNRSSPVQLNITNWKEISGGLNHWYVIKTDGTLWGWGDDQYGESGRSVVALTSTPVQIGSMTNWNRISAGSYTAHAIKTDGTLWGWGYNQNGAIGNNTVSTSYNSPIQIGTDNTWMDIASTGHHTFGIKSNGTLWAWGDNTYGGLGDGTIAHKSTPVQIGALTNWLKIFRGYDTSYALKTDGTLWGWGYNLDGQLGVGDINHRSSPIQIGSMTNWKIISPNHFSFSAITQNATATASLTPLIPMLSSYTGSNGVLSVIDVYDGTGTFVGWKMCDYDKNTFWASLKTGSGKPHWVQYSFDVPTVVTAMGSTLVNPANSYGWDQGRIEYSDNNSNWTTASLIYNTNTWEEHIHYTTHSSAHRYWRFTILHSFNGTATESQLTQWQLYQ